MKSLNEIKYLPHDQWSDIAGIIAEIDKTNFIAYIEDTKFTDYFIFYKDVTCGERLKKGHYVFLFVWDYLINGKPAILGYFQIDSIEFAPRINAWKPGDESHSTFNNLTIFNKYFQQNHALKITFKKIHIVKKKFFADDANIVSYNKLLINYFNVGSRDEIFDIENVFPYVKVGNTYLVSQLSNVIKQIIDKSDFSRSIGDKPLGEFRKEFQDNTSMENKQMSNIPNIKETKINRVNVLYGNIEKNFNSINGYEEILNKPNISGPEENKFKEEMSRLVKQNLEYEKEYRDIVAELTCYENMTLYLLVRNYLDGFQAIDLDNIIYRYKKDFMNNICLEQKEISLLEESIEDFSKNDTAIKSIVDTIDDEQYIKENVSELSKLIQNETSLENKLILSFPIIPFILKYEVNMKMASKVNMKMIWEKIKKCV